MISGVLPTSPLTPASSPPGRNTQWDTETETDTEIYSALFYHILNALWAIPPDQLVPRNQAAVVALSATISALAKLARPPKVEF